MNQVHINSWLQRWRFLVEKIRRLDSETDLGNWLNALITSSTPQMLAFVNAHAMNTTVESVRFYDALMVSDTIFRDGIGMKLLYKSIGLNPGLNLNGTDLIPKIMKKFNGKTISIYGTAEPYLSRASKTIASSIAPQSKLNIADGFMHEQNYVDLAKKQQPALIVLGMGMPKQEEVAMKIRKEINFPCLIVCGGAIIDFLGGKVNRAPYWMRKTGMEWAYRLAMEPRRLVKRYVLGNPKFLLHMYSFRRKYSIGN